MYYPYPYFAVNFDYQIVVVTICFGNFDLFDIIVDRRILGDYLASLYLILFKKNQSLQRIF